MSSPEDPMLAFLEGKNIVVTSVLLTSTGIVGLIIWERALFSKTAKRKSLLRMAGGYSCLEGGVETECCAAGENVCGQAMSMKRAT